ncbi:hypothetical protein FIC_00023 [Flavobacteriaceae bacterium 3519-10]|nr:hypothetical protein FIC_00023 [Flavobacteriaceae bacterium 3519-10]
MKKSLIAIVFLVAGAVMVNAQTTQKTTKATKESVKANVPAVSTNASAELRTDTLTPNAPAVQSVDTAATIKIDRDSALKAEATDLKQNEATRKTEAKKFESQ